MVPSQESARQSLCAQAHGGKSGLHRARCQVTPGRREPTESATERYRLSAAQAAPVRVKWCGKSAPRGWQHQRHGKPHLEQDQIGKHAAPVGRTMWPAWGLPGRSLELRGDAHPRGMTVQDRTRLNGRLFFSARARGFTGRGARTTVAGFAGRRKEEDWGFRSGIGEVWRRSPLLTPLARSS